MEWNGASKLLVNQPYVCSIDDLYQKAENVYQDFKQAVEEIASATASTAMVPGLKGKKRAMEKAKFKYSDGNGVAYYRLTDIVRATLIFDNIADMFNGLEYINKSCSHFNVIEFNDRFEAPILNSGGYRDLQLAVRLKDGFVCELQMSTKAMIQVKQMFGHRDYEVYRRLKAAGKHCDVEQIEATLLFCQEQLGSKTKSKQRFLPKRCYPLVHEAAKLGYADILDRLIDCGADVDFQDKEENTALHYAVFYGHERCVWLLLNKHKCQTSVQNKDKETALMRGYTSFYSQPSEQTRRAITTLLQSSDLEHVEETARGFRQLVRSKLHQSKELVDCASDGNCSRMRELLRTFANPDSSRDGKSALIEAVISGRTSAVELLIEFDVSVTRNIVFHPPVRNQYEIANAFMENQFMKSHGVLFPPEVIPCGVDGDWKWSGIAVCGTKLFCAPLRASSILVIDGETEETHTIPCGVDRDFKWSGIAVCGTKLFCAPHDTSSILVIDGETEETHTIPCGEDGDSKWSGITVCGTKLFCAPAGANSILVIDGETEETHTIPCGVDGGSKWSGIAVCGTKLFCAPFSASSIVVTELASDIWSVAHLWRCKNKSRLHNNPALIESAACGDVEKIIHLLFGFADENSSRDGVTALDIAARNGHKGALNMLLKFNASKTQNTLIQAVAGKQFEMAKTFLDCHEGTNDVLLVPALSPCGVDGSNGKWEGIAVCGTKLFCAPKKASSILVIDGETEETHTIPCGVGGDDKWSGIAVYGTKLFCAPFSASSILVIDGETEETHTIPCGVDRDFKWSGIAVCGTKLFCAPFSASSILVIDGETEETHTIPCGVDGDFKWSGIAVCDTKLFCAPAEASSILVIDGETEETHTIPCGVDGDWKWSGIAVCGTKLFCAPFSASSIMVLKDHLPLLV